MGMRSKASLPLILCVLCAWLAGCATSGDFESLKGTVANLEVESVSQKKEINSIKTSLPEIASDLSTLKEQGFTAIKESQTSLFTQTSDLSKEVQMLKGRFDENKYATEKTIKDLLAERELLQAKIAALENETTDLKTKFSALAAQVKDAAIIQEQKAAANTNTPPGDSSAAVQQKAPEGVDTATPQKLYDDAQIDFKEKKYTDARHKFEKFAKDNAKHSLAPNAMFWIGETYYAEKKYEDAILAYDNFLKKYPSHDKARGAMLKQAFSFIEIGDKKTGKVILESLIEKYPQSTEADLAEKKIAEVLSKNNHHSSGGSTKSKKKKR
ncbi:MAG TPA: tol-pal system protein YbgF [Dissulfurispiraceae bacterium]